MPEHVQDKGFKRVFTTKRYFLEFLNRYMTENLAEGVQENHISLVNGEYTGPDLRRLESDIVYHVKNQDQDIYYYVSLELQSKNDFTMPYRMLLYLTERIRETVQNDKESYQREGYRVPAVIPVVFYSGRRPWTALQSFREYTYHGDRYGKHVIDFEYELVSLRDLSVEQMESGNTGLDAILFFARNVLLGDIQKAFELLRNMIQKILRTDWSDIIDFVLDVYGEKVLGNHSKDDLHKIFMKGDVNKVEAALDDLQRVILEQEEKKLEEGIEVGKRESAINMLRLGAEKEFVIKVTGLSSSEIEELKRQLQ